MRKSMPQSQIRALAMAMAGGAAAAIATMFVPAAILEGVTGATGLSELVHAARAPLGDTARALIAFGTGAITLAVLAYFLLRQESAHGGRAVPAVPASDWAADENDASSFKDRLARIKLPSVGLPKMPWQKGDDDITELSDLPKLRNGDSHPDAPPRRPLVASEDLPVLDLAEVAVAVPEADEDLEAEAQEFAQVEVLHDEPAAEPLPVAANAFTASPIAPADVEPTLAEMVAQLEAAVAERQSQLAELEAVAAQLGADQVVERVPAEQIVVEDQPSEPVRTERQPLEAVPASVKDDDMDSALAAALATLHRMNGTNR